MGRRSTKSLTESIETEVITVQADLAVEAPRGLGQRIEKTRVRQKSYLMDLRIHSPASLGYLGIDGLDAAPALVRLAKIKGLDVIAVTDFYSGQFVDRVIKAAQAANSPLTIIPGVVVRCIVGECDDVLLVCLFPEHYNSGLIEQFLAALDVPQSAIGRRNYLLTKPVSEIMEVVEQSQGIIVPSRMDKTPSRLAVVPLMVERYGFRAFDLAYADSARYFKSRWPKIKFQLFSFSNANTLAQVGSRMSRVKMTIPGFDGLKQLVARERALAS
jgi:hypothetical protein